MKVLTSTCSSSPVEPILVSVEHWLTVLCTHSIFSSTWQAGLGGQTCQLEEERDQRIWQNSASSFQSIAHHSSLQTYLVTFLQSFSSLMLHVGRNSVSQTTFSTWTTDVKKMQLSQQKMKSHLRLLDFLLNCDHFQPTARRKGLRRNIVKPNIIYL